MDFTNKIKRRRNNNKNIELVLGSIGGIVVMAAFMYGLALCFAK